MNIENNFYVNNVFILLIVSKVCSRGEKIIVCILYIWGWNREVVYFL